MEATVRHVGDVSVVDVRGKITLGDGDMVLRQRVSELLERKPPYILLNLAQVSYMDSCGLVELISCQRRARKSKAEIKLLSPSPKVGRLLEMTRLDQVFETFRDEKEAVGSFLA